MKKKLLVLVAMLLCVVTVLSSCASSMRFGKVVGDGTYNDENPTLTTTVKLDVTGTLNTSKGDLAYFKGSNAEGKTVSTVYNLATGTTVWSATASLENADSKTTTVTHSVALYEQWDASWFMVTTTTAVVSLTDTGSTTETKKAISLRNAKGEEFGTSANKHAAEPDTWLDLIRFDGKVYRIANDASIAYAFDMSDLSRMPISTNINDAKVGDYYVGEYGIFDSNLNLVYADYVPSYAVNADIHSLSNGNALIQYWVEQDSMSDDYDFISNYTTGGYLPIGLTDAKKYNLVTKLLNVEKGTLKEIKCDFYVDQVESHQAYDEDWDYNEDIKNLAYVWYIEDRQLDMSLTAEKLVVLSDKGKVKGIVDDLIENQACNGIQLVASNRWIVSNKAGQEFLINEKGDVLGEVTNIDWENDVTGTYFVLNNKIYDWDLNVKCDLNEQKMENIVSKMSHSVLFNTEDGEYKLYTNGEVKTIVAKDALALRTVQVLSKDVFAINVVDATDSGKVKCEIYNDAGTLLTTIEDAAFTLTGAKVMTADSTNAILIAGLEIVTGDALAKTVYYRIG